MNLMVFINESIYHHHFKAFLKTKKMRLTQRIFSSYSKKLILLYEQVIFREYAQLYQTTHVSSTI